MAVKISFRDGHNYPLTRVFSSLEEAAKNIEPDNWKTCLLFLEEDGGYTNDVGDTWDVLDIHEKEE